MNRNEGKYQLSHVFDDLLKKSSGNMLLSNSQHQEYTDDHHSVDNDDCKWLKRSHSQCDFGQICFILCSDD